MPSREEGAQALKWHIEVAVLDSIENVKASSLINCRSLLLEQTGWLLNMNENKVKLDDLTRILLAKVMKYWKAGRKKPWMAASAA